MMRQVTRIVVLALLLQLTSASQFLALAQTKPVASATQYKAELQQFDDFVARQMKFDKTPGLTIGFIKDGFVWTKGYGYADLENKVPAKAESAYRLASVSKSMTAVAIMQLVEKKKIDLDAEVQTYVSYFPKKQWPVTVRQVLGHIGGISHYKNDSLNNIAYQVGNAGMVDEAMALLSTAIEMYPKEANLYDSLGEFQLRKGDKVRALAWYQKALEVDPNFSNAAAAREVVKKLTEETAQKN